MNEFSTAMALTDFLPVILFAVAAVIMQRDFYDRMPKYAFACFAAGCMNAFLAGFLKALWKLLYALNICDFQLLNTMFLPVQSIGLMLMGFGLILMLCRRHAALAVAPPVFAGTFVFIAMMVLGLGAMCACLGVIAARMKKKKLLIVLGVIFLCYMTMGYLASREGNSAVMNWVEQGINTLGQALLLFSVVKLHRGLREQAAEEIPVSAQAEPAVESAVEPAAE